MPITNYFGRIIYNWFYLSGSLYFFNYQIQNARYVCICPSTKYQVPNTKYFYYLASLNIFIKIITLILCQVAGFIAAVTGYEVIKISYGTPYDKPLWGLDIPFVYQTEKIYSNYCLFISLGFLVLCIFGVITALKNKKIFSIIISIGIIVTIIILIFLNGRYEISGLWVVGCGQ